MANAYSGNLIGAGVEFGASVTNCAIKTGKSLSWDPISPVGVLAPSVTGTSADTNEFINNTASDIAGYSVLSGTNDFLAHTYTGTTGNLGPGEETTIAIMEFVTASGAFDNKNAENESANFVFRAYWAQVSGSDAPLTAEIICDIYHRTAAPAELLIGTLTQAITSTSTKYTVSVTQYHSWYASNRYVVKWKARFIAGPEV